MKTRFLLIAIFLVGMGVASYAQKENCHRYEAFKAKKVAVITENLDLSVEEAQKFWPVYNEKEEKQEKIINRKKEIMEKLKDGEEGMATAELEKLSDELIETYIKEADLKKEYHEKFKKVLPVEKVLELYHTEHTFKRDLLRELRGHRGPGPHKGPPNSHGE